MIVDDLFIKLWYLPISSWYTVKILKPISNSWISHPDRRSQMWRISISRIFFKKYIFYHFEQDVSEKRIPIMLCGNKLDLRSDLIDQGCRCVTSENGEKLAREHSATFLETSSKDGDNVLDALVQLSRWFFNSVICHRQTIVSHHELWIFLQLIVQQQDPLVTPNNVIKKFIVCLLH